MKYIERSMINLCTSDDSSHLIFMSYQLAKRMRALVICFSSRLAKFTDINECFDSSEKKID